MLKIDKFDKQKIVILQKDEKKGSFIKLKYKKKCIYYKYSKK